MTTLREAAQQALEALDAGVSVSPKSVLHDRLRAALAQQEQEPVAWMDKGSIAWLGEQRSLQRRKVCSRREWRGLTMQEINALPEVGGRMWNMGSAVAVLQAIRAIEAALKEKNNG
jgi:hypothetical protein